MNKSLKITKVNEYRKAGTGNLIAAFAVTGHPDVVKEYIADKTKDLGSCPMVDGTNNPRFTGLAGQYPAKSYELRKSQNGKWSVIDNSDAATIKTLLSTERDPVVKAELAKMYAQAVIAQARSGASTSAVSAPAVEAEEKL